MKRRQWSWATHYRISDGAPRYFSAHFVEPSPTFTHAALCLEPPTKNQALRGEGSLPTPPLAPCPQWLRGLIALCVLLLGARLSLIK
jgi:hypothetical protein